MIKKKKKILKCIQSIWFAKIKRRKITGMNEVEACDVKAPVCAAARSGPWRCQGSRYVRPCLLLLPLFLFSFFFFDASDRLIAAFPSGEHAHSLSRAVTPTALWAFVTSAFRRHSPGRALIFKGGIWQACKSNYFACVTPSA